MSSKEIYDLRRRASQAPNKAIFTEEFALRGVPTRLVLDDTIVLGVEGHGSPLSVTGGSSPARLRGLQDNRQYSPL